MMHAVPLTFTQNRFMVCTVKEGNHMYQGIRGDFRNEILVLIPSGVPLSLSRDVFWALKFPTIQSEFVFHGNSIEKNHEFKVWLVYLLFVMDHKKLYSF